MSLIFGSFAVISALLVITENNSIHSVFFLVFAFINSALILIDWGVDYLGLLLIIVYVGAIAILFLFVVMMINIKFEEINRSYFVPIAIIVAAAFVAQVYFAFPLSVRVTNFKGWLLNADYSNLDSLALYLFQFNFIFVASFILLVAMIGAIVLTLSHSDWVKRQDLFS